VLLAVLRSPIGVDCCPDSPVSILAMRTTAGRHVVCLGGEPDPKSPQDVDAYRRIRRIRDAIPQRLVPRPTVR
jgi:hypothetical protein